MYTGGAARPEAGRRQSEAWPARPSQNFKKSGQQGRTMGIPSPEAGALASLGTRIVPSFAGETRKRDRFPRFCPADSTRRPSRGQICPKSVPRPAGQAWGGDGSAKIRPAAAVTARSRDGRSGPGPRAAAKRAHAPARPPGGNPGGRGYGSPARSPASRPRQKSKGSAAVFILPRTLLPNQPSRALAK